MVKACLIAASDAISFAITAKPIIIAIENKVIIAIASSVGNSLIAVAIVID